MGAAQHAHMESSVDAIVSRCVQNIIYCTRLGKDLERSKPFWQQLARTNSLKSDMLTVKPSHLSNHLYAFHQHTFLTLLCGLQADFGFGNCLFNTAHELISLCILASIDSFLALRTQGEITRQPQVLAIVELERKGCPECLLGKRCSQQTQHRIVVHPNCFVLG